MQHLTIHEKIFSALRVLRVDHPSPANLTTERAPMYQERKKRYTPARASIG